MLTKRESELDADAVTVVCGGDGRGDGCGDEYLAYVSWRDHAVVVERDKKCACPLNDVAERAAITLHYNPPDHTAPGLRDADERADLEDRLYG